MILFTVSIHSGTPAQNARIQREMEQTLGFADDPLDILLAEEQGEFDDELACRYLASSLTIYVTT
jgi:hypothetical protein